MLSSEKNIRVNVYDFAVFLRENFMEIYNMSSFGGVCNDDMDAVSIKFNDILQKSSPQYGYFYDEEWYWPPSTAIAMKAIKQIFGLHRSDGVMIIPSAIFEGYEKIWNEYRRPTNNSVRKRRWRRIKKVWNEVDRARLRNLYNS